MKIIYVANSSIPSRSANSIHVMRMCSAFASLGHTVTLLIPSRTDHTEDNVSDIFDFYGVKNDFKVQRIWHPYFKGKDLINIILTCATIFRINPDLVYGRCLHHCYFASKIGYDVIYEAHDLIPNDSKVASRYLQYLFQNKRLKKFIVISKALRDLYGKMYDLADVICQVAHDGADIPSPSNSDIEHWPGRIGCLQCGYAGHLYHGRGIEIIIELASRFQTIDFHLVGGTEEDIAYWQKKITHLNIYFHGFLQPSLLAEWRGRCDILLAPYQKNLSTFGGDNDTSSFMSPLKIFEYMSSAKAMIASDLPVLREVLNEKNSILVTPNDIEEWANALLTLEDKVVRMDIANRAYLDFSTQYTWLNRAQTIIDTP